MLFNITKMGVLIAADTRQIIVRTKIHSVHSTLALDNALSRCYSRSKSLYLFRGYISALTHPLNGFQFCHV